MTHLSPQHQPQLSLFSHSFSKNHQLIIYILTLPTDICINFNIYPFLIYTNISSLPNNVPSVSQEQGNWCAKEQIKTRIISRHHRPILYLLPSPYPPGAPFQLTHQWDKTSLDKQPKASVTDNHTGCIQTNWTGDKLTALIATKGICCLSSAGTVVNQMNAEQLLEISRRGKNPSDKFQAGTTQGTLNIYI